jgi:3-methyladenine DNA glycosylase AlkD
MVRNSKIIKKLRKQLVQESDSKASAGARAYMRNQFVFIGVATPIRRKITRSLMNESKTFTEKELVSLCQDLWEQKEREFQYVACDLLIKNSNRLSQDFVTKQAKWFITTKSWWDTVDALRTAIEPVIDRNPQLRKLMDQWVKYDNIWMVRVAIIHQLKLGKRTDVIRLEKYCALRAKDQEFFIAKAIGWALRSYSYTDPRFVKKFIKSHPDLQTLSVREGLKAINRNN